jgi:polyhydroxybutyrate depolymerase
VPICCNIPAGLQQMPGIAAIGGVSGAYMIPWSEYKPKRPVPMILFHGTSDPIVPFQGGPWGRFKIPFPNITNWVQTLAASNGCNSIPTPLSGNGNVSGLRYSGGAHNADVDFYTIEGGGHTWPGGKDMPALIVGKTTHDADATRLMWTFFHLHPMPER